MGPPSLLLPLKHGQVSRQVLTKSTQVLVTDGPFVEALAQVLNREGCRDADEYHDEFGEMAAK